MDQGDDLNITGLDSQTATSADNHKMARDTDNSKSRPRQRHSDDTNTRLGQYRRRRSLFQDAHTAHNFLTSNLQTRVTRNERIRENRALNADMAETMCEVFNKHFYPNALGGRCL